MRWKRITRSVNSWSQVFERFWRQSLLLLWISSLETGKNVTVLWTRNQKILVDRIRNQWMLSEFSEEEIHTICGILEVNCFEVGGQNGTSVRALYPEAYLMCHDCVPNTNHTDDLITHELTVRTTKPLKRGETITLSYAYTLQVITFQRHCLPHRHGLHFLYLPTGNAKKTTAFERGKVFLVHLPAMQKQWWIVDSCQHVALSQMHTWVHCLRESARWKRWVEVKKLFFCRA